MSFVLTVITKDAETVGYVGCAGEPARLSFVARVLWLKGPASACLGGGRVALAAVRRPEIRTPGGGVGLWQA